MLAVLLLECEQAVASNPVIETMPIIASMCGTLRFRLLGLLSLLIFMVLISFMFL